MFRQIIRNLQRSPAESPEQAPYQIEHASSLDWQPLDVCRLDLTNQRLRQIEANLAEKTRAEFAAVTMQLKNAQLPKAGQELEPVE